ncbi:forkhead box protein H1-like [Hippocampus comes]|nr:PREDICTED: forkhead box protein H1-like [Hippocampus comes]
MDRMGPLAREDRKSIENNIRVCLSTNKCFVKIPLVPDCLGSKRNFWKLDLSHITTKMVRRHFQDLLDFFPELSGRSKDGTWSAAPPLPLPPPPPPPPSVQISCEVKFSGPFSIESLLKRDSPAPARTSPLVNVPVQSDYPRLYHSTPLDQKRRISGDEESLLSGHYHSFVSCPAGGAAHHKTSKPFCTGPPFPTYAVTPFNQSYNPIPTYDPHRFFF